MAQTNEVGNHMTSVNKFCFIKGSPAFVSILGASCPVQDHRQ